MPTEKQIRQAADLLGDEYYMVALVQHVCRDVWAHRPPDFWLWQFDHELDELWAALRGEHEHPPEWEVTQIAALCINWLRHHAREGWLLECIGLLDKKGEVEGGR